jgi:hypothetical protein
MIKIELSNPTQVNAGDLLLFGGRKGTVELRDEVLVIGNMSVKFIFENFDSVEVIKNN